MRFHITVFKSLQVILKRYISNIGKQECAGTRYESVKGYPRKKVNCRSGTLKQNQVVTLFSRKEKHISLFVKCIVNQHLRKLPSWSLAHFVKSCFVILSEVVLFLNWSMSFTNFYFIQKPFNWIS